jgi:hypothetical protein
MNDGIKGMPNTFPSNLSHHIIDPTSIKSVLQHLLSTPADISHFAFTSVTPI